MKDQNISLETFLVMQDKGFTETEINILLSNMREQQKAILSQYSHRVYWLGGGLAFLILFAPGALQQLLLWLVQ